MTQLNPNKIKLKELENKLEKAKNTRNVKDYGSKKYYTHNEKYINWLEKEIIELIQKM